jgi:hypothetical protein
VQQKIRTPERRSHLILIQFGRSLVLPGDPQLLEQPQMRSHPEDPYLRRDIEYAMPENKINRKIVPAYYCKKLQRVQRRCSFVASRQRKGMRAKRIVGVSARDCKIPQCAGREASRLKRCVG